MSQTCGRLGRWRTQSFSGGSQTTSPPTRQGSPPMNLTPFPEDERPAPRTRRRSTDRRAGDRGSPSRRRGPLERSPRRSPQATAASVISRARSMIAKPSASSSSLMVSGGLVRKCSSGRTCRGRPRGSACRGRPSRPLVPLKGAIGSIVSRLRTSSTIPNRPMLRVAPTLGCRAASCSWWTFSARPSAPRARSAPPPRSTSIVARAVAQASGCEL